jgi:hypothetical protein
VLPINDQRSQNGTKNPGIEKRGAKMEAGRQNFEPALPKAEVSLLHHLSVHNFREPENRVVDLCAVIITSNKCKSKKNVAGRDHSETV